MTSEAKKHTIKFLENYIQIEKYFSTKHFQLIE